MSPRDMKTAQNAITPKSRESKILDSIVRLSNCNGIFRTWPKRITSPDFTAVGWFNFFPADCRFLRNICFALFLNDRVQFGTHLSVKTLTIKVTESFSRQRDETIGSTMEILKAETF